MSTSCSTRRSKSLGFEFLKPARSGRTVVEATGLEVSAGDKELLHDAAFAVERGEHVGLVGPNGSGKTTLLETILGKREPGAGTVRLGYGVEAAYFSQHEVELDERGSILDCAQRATGLQRPQAQSLLGRFLFSGWETHEKPVVALSGGERRRLALALVVASGSNFLVLDEPTNHLDLESREALEEALDAFPGPSCSCRTTARCSTRWPRGCSRSRTDDPLVRGRLGGVRPEPGRRGGTCRASRLRRSREAEEAPPPSEEAPDPAGADRGRDRLARGARRRARAPVGRGLVGRRHGRGAPARARRAAASLLAQWEELFESSR